MQQKLKISFRKNFNILRVEKRDHEDHEGIILQELEYPRKIKQRS